ncbi:conserved protein of unknown function [Pseudomonas sp. JV551A1]|uniref:Uncharacterized protein n=1 Tax=Pseudomonas inefficax TaxID=2078786 RepID=A0AAQ1PAH4_9PSED|nr:hypothetical protein [Pseudomonas]SPO56159.1 conserved protein of unknown function [Pseudomonas sp. JV551A1]SPO62256.1 conserved protein of unknown function [Pseudomonas inefficax]
MDIQALQLSLLPWLRVDTWHTMHPKDEERFHQALHVAFGELGYSIAYEQFYEAIHRTLSERQPGVEVYRSKTIEEFARRAEVISSYLFDVRNCQ